MADTSLAGESATLLADLQSRLRLAEEIRRRNIRRMYAGVAVAVLHFFIVLLLINSQWVPVPIAKPKQIEALQWVLLPAQRHAAEAKPIKPRTSDGATVNPNVIPRILRPKEEEENNAITDLGWALGRSLACGANSYEWLNSKMRAECRRRPWDFVYDRYGNVVLNARPRDLPDHETLRPSDVQAQERNTAPTCPQNVDPNAPCLSAIIGGRR